MTKTIILWSIARIKSPSDLEILFSYNCEFSFRNALRLIAKIWVFPLGWIAGMIGKKAAGLCGGEAAAYHTVRWLWGINGYLLSFNCCTYVQHHPISHSIHSNRMRCASTTNNHRPPTATYELSPHMYNQWWSCV